MATVEPARAAGMVLNMVGTAKASYIFSNLQFSKWQTKSKNILDTNPHVPICSSGPAWTYREHDSAGSVPWLCYTFRVHSKTMQISGFDYLRLGAVALGRKARVSISHFVP